MNNRERLVKWACTKIGTPFVWGKSDCTIIALEGIKMYYNLDFFLDKSWSSLKDALKTYKKCGTPIDLLIKEGFTPVKKNFEQTGDVFIWEGNGYYLLGLVINNSVMVANEGELLHMRPISAFESYLCLRKGI